MAEGECSTADLVSLILNAGLLAQQPVSTNSIGMEFVLIKPGEMTVGRYEPPYAQPASDPAGPGRGRGFSAEQYKEAEAQAKAAYMPGFLVKIDHSVLHR